MAKVLLIEDDSTLALAIERALTLERHSIDCTADGAVGLQHLRVYQYDLAIIDWLVPSLSGLEVCQRYRTTGGQIPILMLTGKKTIKENQAIEIGDVVVDLSAGKVTKKGKEIKLSAKEFALLEFFSRHPNQVFSPETLIGYIWTADKDASPDSIRAYINRLRTKLDDPSLISTVHKLGYRLDLKR